MKRGIQKIPIHHFGLESVLDSMANSRSEKGLAHMCRFHILVFRFPISLSGLHIFMFNCVCDAYKVFHS